MAAPSPEPVASSPGLDAIRSLLISAEPLESHAIQRRLFALTHRRLVVGATSGRLIAVQRGLASGFTVRDVRWQVSRARRARREASASPACGRTRRRRSTAPANFRSRPGGRSGGSGARGDGEL